MHTLSLVIYKYVVVVAPVSARLSMHSLLYAQPPAQNPALTKPTMNSLMFIYVCKLHVHNAIGVFSEHMCCIQYILAMHV